ncbi:MAG: hypothetical protein BWZ02_00022 [Lentisphaerae bacterium ADurb.BinA184]|nr:MAG: hypothetical protein BWZ02_00022 [Lentisphaerae bacterium ADurb.BinA184]
MSSDRRRVAARVTARVLIPLAGVFIVKATGGELARFELRECLGLTYAAQPVHGTVEIPRGALKETARCTLRDGAGQALAAQVKAMDGWDDGSVRHARVSFLTELEPLAHKSFTLDDSGQAPPDDGTLTLTRGPDTLVLASPLAAVEIPGRRNWFGRGWITLDSSFRLQGRTVTVSDDGPIVKRVMVTSSYVKGAKSNTFVGDVCLHAVEVTLCRGEELVRIKESFSFPFTDLAPQEFAFDFYPGFEPDTSVCRPAWSAEGPTFDVGSSWDLQPYQGPMFPLHYDRDDTVGSLTPWSAHPQAWVHFGCYREAAGAEAEMAGVMITAPEAWDHIAYISPDDSWRLVQNPHAFFTMKRIKDVRLSVGRGGGLVAHFPLSTGAREWAFFVGGPFPRTTPLPAKAGETGEPRQNAAAPRDYFKAKVNHYAFNPLDRVKDWVLAWPEAPDVAYPHLYYSREEFEARRQTYNAWEGQKTVPALDDPAALAKLKDAVLQLADEAVQRMAVNPGPPHHVTQVVYPAANLADLLLGTDALSPDERNLLRARLAYMAYRLNWRGYWAPELGYAANPNMTSFCYDAVGLLGLLLADHPEAENWVRACTTEIDRELAGWISDDGAWIESLGYVRAAWHEHSMLMTALKHTGRRDYFRDPRVQKFFRYYFTAQTPPHPERGYQRTLAIIGHVFGMQAVDEFNVWARGLADGDPALSGALQWMWKEFGFGNSAEMKGRTLYRASGADFSHWFGGVRGLPPYKEIALNDPALEAVAPTDPGLRLGGRFRGFGAILNSHFGGRQETKLYLRQGAYYSHWDADQGGIVFWGKGAPLVLDHGYGEYHPWFHSRVNVNHMYDDDLGEVTACFAGEGGAFVQGDITLSRLSLREHAWVKEWPFKPEPINGRSLRTDWRRRIVFMKDPVPEGPNYLVVRDTVRGELPTEWVLWAYGAVADLQATPIRARGQFGVDLLVYLLDADKGTVNTGRLDFSAEPAWDARPKQTLIHLLRPAGRGTLAVLYPALPAETPPQVTPLHDGAVVRLSAGPRTDWVFLPESRATLEADGVRFEGHTGSFSKRQDGLHYMLDRQGTLTAEGLTLTCNTPCELRVQGNQAPGRASAAEATPTLVLAGPVSERITAATCEGAPVPLTREAGRVTLRLPPGREAFAFTLR